MLKHVNINSKLYIIQTSKQTTKDYDEAANGLTSTGLTDNLSSSLRPLEDSMVKYMLLA